MAEVFCQRGLTVLSEVTGKANNRFRAGAIIEGGYDYEVGNNIVLGLNASYNFSGTATTGDLTNLGSINWQSQEGTITATGTTTAAPSITAVKLGTSTTLTDLTAAGTFVAKAATDPVLEASGAVKTSARFRMGDNWSVGGRAGFAASSNVLLFASAGYTQAKIGLTANSSVYQTSEKVSGAASAAAITKLVDLKPVSASKWKEGFYVGGGFEAKLTQAISLKAEYRFSDFGSYSVSNTEDVPVGNAAYALDVPVDTTVSAKNIQSHALRVSVAYRF